MSKKWLAGALLLALAGGFWAAESCLRPRFDRQRVYRIGTDDARVSEEAPTIHLTKPWLRNEFAVVTLPEFHRSPIERTRSVSFQPGATTRAIAAKLFGHAARIETATREQALEAMCRGQVSAAMMEVRYATAANSGREATDNSALGKSDALRDEIEAMAASGELDRVLSPWAFFNANDAQAIHRLAAVIAALIAAAAIVSILQWRRYRAAAVAARQAQRRLDEVLTNIQEVVWSRSLDADKSAYVSPGVIKVYGRRPEEFLEDPYLWNKVIHPEDRERALSSFQKSLQGEPQEMEYRILRPDGTQRWIYDQIFPVRDEKGRVAALNGVAFDVTGRVKAEALVRSNEERFRTLIERSSDIVTLLNPQGVMTFVSPAVAALIGYTANEMIGRRALDFVHPDDAAEVDRQTRSVYKTPSATTTFESRVLHKDGSIRIVECVLRNLTHLPAVNALVANGRDITQRKRAEEERERLIFEMEAKNTELERFTYTVSHDLKGPLITIRGYLDFVRDSLLSGRTEEGLSDLERIRIASIRLQEMLDHLLELSRIGRILHPKQEAPFGELVSEAVELVAGPIRERGVRIEVEPNLPAVSVDRPRMVEVLQNLIENAVKFSGNRPAPQVRIGVRRQNGEPVFFVEDNGIGIEPRFHEKIFGLFDKLDSSTEGSGIGLALVRRIIDFHGGRVWVDSEGEGKGATFCFTLPEGKAAGAA